MPKFPRAQPIKVNKKANKPDGDEDITDEELEEDLRECRRQQMGWDKHAPVELIDELTQVKASVHFVGRSVCALAHEDSGDSSLSLSVSEAFSWIEWRLNGVIEALKKGERK